jgi:hypothetical protein
VGVAIEVEGEPAVSKVRESVNQLNMIWSEDVSRSGPVWLSSWKPIVVADVELGCQSSGDGGQTWWCEYERTDYNGPDYWDLGDDYFHTTGQCEYTSVAYCDGEFHPGGGSPYNAPRYVSRTASDDAVLPIPVCPAKATDDIHYKAYCAGHTPNQTERANIDAALARMHQLGGICDTLASIGDRLLQRGVLHLFPQSSYKFGGAAPTGGGDSGPDSWAILSQDDARLYYDAAHSGEATEEYSGLHYRIDLQAKLAHELDHLHGNHHEGWGTNHESQVFTPNTRQCADLDMTNGY